MNILVLVNTKVVDNDTILYSILIVTDDVHVLTCINELLCMQYSKVENYSTNGLIRLIYIALNSISLHVKMPKNE